MPSITRLGDVDTGHGGWPPRGNVEGSPDVFANELPVHRETDEWPVHCDDSDCHDSQLEQGSINVFVNNLGASFSSSLETDGSFALQGSPNVFVNSVTGNSYMVDNTPAYSAYIDPITNTPLVTPPVGATETTSGFEYHTMTHDDEESSTEDPSPPPETPPNSYEVPTPIEEDNVPPPSTTTPIHNCTDVDALPDDFTWQAALNPINNAPYVNFAQFANSIQLSTHFTLADLTIKTAVSTYEFGDTVTVNGLTQKQIMNNLCFHANTVLELVYSTYGHFLVTSCFRAKTGSSQHNKGQASDIQFPGFTSQQYWDRAQAIKTDINFDQMILEYGGINPWFHLSSNMHGHRHQVLTQVSPNTYQSGLIRII